MTTTTSGRFVANEGGPTPQNVETRVAQIPMNEACTMTQEEVKQRVWEKPEREMVQPVKEEAFW